MSRRRLKDRLYDQLARIGKAVGSGRRLELLEILAQGERTVEKLARETGLSVANASHHLHVLRQAQLVDSRKAGLYVFYRLTDPNIYDLSRLIREIAERHLAEVSRIVETFLTARDQLEPVAREDLLERARAGAVLVLDVRPSDEYRAGHIPGAVSVPVEELENRISELPTGKEVVAYCRGPYCVLAFRAVEILRARGHYARRLMDGFPEWRAAGLPIEVSTTEEAA
ncbi:MAG: metalloregulator ArsR/SmtB family transcription factor [Gemmatimonadaceae bacterium]|nr:metalloregulator ArsR/SmtB family transcription factor [Gemmatimonadaceae bacterium]